MTTGGYRGRFAPTPSGPLHFGSLLAALASFLEARRLGGVWLLRIDDIDRPRVAAGAADRILRSLERHGLLWDGAVRYQSYHLDQYQAALERLTSAGLTYPCTCSRRELAALAAAGPIYPGYCRTGPRRPGRPAAIRLRVPACAIAFDDIVQGCYGQQLASAVGDFVIRRADAVVAYQLAVVVDDAAQGVTHVVRGSDLLDSTPRQIHLQRLLGLATPVYGHIPVVVDRQGRKLSKQTGARALADDQPGPALVAALACLGQSPPSRLAAATVTDILAWAAEHWSLQRLPARREIAFSGGGMPG